MYVAAVITSRGGSKIDLLAWTLLSMEAVVAVAVAVEELRSTFKSGKTKTYEWRVSQLKALVDLVTRHENEILQALHSDLNKPELESFILEV